MFKKIILSLILILSLVMMINNAYYYPVNGGYDAMLHLRYAKIISEEGRIPTFKETRENYNPPLFYLISGLTTRVYSHFTGLIFFEAAKVWQYVNIVLALVSFYLWLAIIKSISPKKSALPLLFAILLLSLPVWYKTIVMFSIETWFLFTVSLAFWFFINHFLSRPNIANTVILGLLLIVNLLSRLSAVALVLTIFIGLLGLTYLKKISWKRLAAIISLLALMIALGTGWFYYGRRNEAIYGVGEGGEPDLPFFKRQPLSFYIDVPFQLMMTYPMRQNMPLNKLIPIYYDEFWGDFWNYYPQRRFGISVAEVRKDREVSQASRIKTLVLQNQINLVPTFLMLTGFAICLYQFLSTLKRPNRLWLVQGIMLTFTIFTWAGFLVLLTKFPSWKGDSIKASYMLSLLPIFIYFLANNLLVLFKFKKMFFWPAIVWLSFSTLINLNFSWF